MIQPVSKKHALNLPFSGAIFICLIAFSLVACGSNGGSSATAPISSSPTSAVFKILDITMAVKPATIAGIGCGTEITATYTATFHITPGSPGGTIQFHYTMNNGRSSSPAKLVVGPGKTTATYTFAWSGQLPVDHVVPGPGGVMTDSPNSVTSPLVVPRGICRAGA